MSEPFLPDLAVCVPMFPPGTEFDIEELPSAVDPRSTSRKELALARYKVWQEGQCLRIRFLDGEPALHRRVESRAREWLEYANLEFEFGNYPDAEIRVTFKGYGYRSLTGTDTLKQPSPKPTMILGRFTAKTDPLELKRVVLHEFGHALGCVHEQASPSIDIPWDKKKVYKWYKYNYGWSKKKVDRNVLRRYQKHEVKHTKYHDPASIMQYPVPNELTVGDVEFGWNDELSEVDKAFIAAMYP